MSKGKVFLIGAGPGDPELITLKAIKTMKTADVILYDRLINEDILKHAPKKAEIIFVGKELGKQNEIQHKIYQLFLKFAKDGKTIIRLKGGDPFIFGRGAEEIEFLIKNQIDYEVIPGVSSALSIPIQYTIPLTHRKLSSSFCIVTGHEDPKKERKKIDFKLLSKAVDTIVILMGLKNLSNIVNSLIEGGLTNSTPIAIIQHAYAKDQKIVIAELKNILDKVKAHNLTPPVLIIVGNTIKFFKNN